MNRLTKWVRQHQLTAFFVLAYAITWGAIIPAVALRSDERELVQVLVFYLARIGVYGPVLSGILVTRAAAPDGGEPDRARSSRAARWIAFFATWVVAWAVGCLYLHRAASGEIPLTAIVVLNAPAAMLPAFVVSRAFSRVASMRRYLSTLLRPRGRIGWYLLALLGFPAIHLLGNAIARLIGRASPPSDGAGLELIAFAVLEFLSVLFFSGGINEESGWRGFALPRLQAVHAPLVANLILWFFWAAWHLPIDLVEFSREWHVINRLVLLPFVTILFGWVYNRTQGGILAPALFHASMNSLNVLMDVFPVTTAGGALLVALGLLAIVYDRMWERPPADTPSATSRTPGRAEIPDLADSDDRPISSTDLSI